MQNINKVIQNLQNIESESRKQLELRLAIALEENDRLTQKLKQLEEKTDGDK